MVSNVTEDDEPRGGTSGETSGPSDSRKIFYFLMVNLVSMVI